MATYSDIQRWIKEKYGYTVKTCWIADVKEQCGILTRQAYNRQSKCRVHPCPENKREAIIKAFKYFGMI